LAELDPKFARTFYGTKPMTAQEEKVVKDDLEDFFSEMKLVDASLKSADDKENNSIFGNQNTRKDGHTSISAAYENKKLAENERLKGNECMKAKSYDESIKCYSRSLELDPNQPYTFSNRAMTYLKMK
jgi:tetratricopeptide (TPR) repeat protein